MQCICGLTKTLSSFFFKKLKNSIQKVELEEIEKEENCLNQYQIFNLEPSPWKVVKNIWSAEGILLGKIIEFIRQIKKLEFGERSIKNQWTKNLRHCQQS